MKLNALVCICKHHLAGNVAPLLKVNLEAKDDLIKNLDLSAHEFELASISLPLTLDKIVVYTIFLSQDIYIQCVLELYRIKSLLFMGLQLVMERAASLKMFKWSKCNGPYVLIISNVSLYRLNVMCANIIVVVVSDLAVIYH